MLCVILRSSNHELARSIGDRLHGFDAVENQIEYYLLQLDFVGENDGERVRMFHAQRHTGAEQFVLYEHQCVGEEVTEIQRRHADVGLLRERTDAPNDLTRSSAVPDDSLEGGVRLANVGRVAIEPAQAGRGIVYDGAERLIDFVSDRGRVISMAPPRNPDQCTPSASSGLLPRQCYSFSIGNRGKTRIWIHK